MNHLYKTEHMAELHETSMGVKFLEHTVPEIGRQLKRIADAIEKANVLKERELLNQNTDDDKSILQRSQE